MRKSPIDPEAASASFEKLRKSYESFEKKLAGLVSDLLTRARIKVHVLESRTKTVESFREKITRPGKYYADPLNELSDIVGLRVITYYLDDVKHVGELLGREFSVHATEGTDRVTPYRPNEFGYLSVHHIITLNSPRCELAEWKPFVGFKAEVQVRTVLQHSWAAISHALQYKHENDVPESLRRRLFRLAGLFELVDEEFIGIRECHKAIETEVAAEFDRNSDEILLDAVSVTEYVKRSECVREVVLFAESLGYEIGEGKESYSSRFLEECNRLGLRTIGQLERLLFQKREDYKLFLTMTRRRVKVRWTVSPKFLLYLLLIRACPDRFSERHLIDMGWNPGVVATIWGAIHMDAVDAMSPF